MKNITKKIFAAIVLLATASIAVFPAAASAQSSHGSQRAHSAPAPARYISPVSRAYRPAAYSYGYPYRYGYMAPRVIVGGGWYSGYPYPYYPVTYGYAAPLVGVGTYISPAPGYATGGAILGGVLGGIIGRGTGYRNGWAGALIGSTIGLVAGAAADNAAINNQREAAAMQQTTSYAPAAAQRQPAPAQPQQPTVINNYYGTGNTGNTPMGQANSLFGRQ
jgi:hypothetical protein